MAINTLQMYSISTYCLYRISPVVQSGVGLVEFLELESVVTEGNDSILACVLFTASFSLVSDAMINVMSVDGTAVSFPIDQGIHSLISPIPVINIGSKHL